MSDARSNGDKISRMWRSLQSDGGQWEISPPAPRIALPGISPAFAGVLLTTSFSGLPLVVCGVLKIVYDVALLFSFRHVKPPEERAE